MKKSAIVTAALGLVLALGAPLIGVQAGSLKGGTAAQDPSKEETDAYGAWYNAYTAKDLAKEIELGTAFLEKFASSKNAAYVKNDVARARGLLFNQAMQAKNTAEMIRLGNNALSVDPYSLDYLYLLVVGIRNNELAANPANTSHSTELADYTQRAIKLIEDGKIPTVIDKINWKKDVTLGYLNGTLALNEERKNNKDKALEYYQKAASIDPSNPAFFFSLGALYQGKYVAAAQKFGAFPEADRAAPDAKPEVKAALNDVNNAADAVINHWARFLGLTAKGDTYSKSTRDQIEKALTELYKFRHNDSVEGLQKLIEQNGPGSTPMPAPPANHPGNPPSESSSAAHVASAEKKKP